MMCNRHARDPKRLFLVCSALGRLDREEHVKYVLARPLELKNTNKIESEAFRTFVVDGDSSKRVVESEPRTCNIPS